MTDRTVLVVDDDFMVASIHTRFVERIPGFAVVGTAATGGAALAEVAGCEPDLVLLDVHLPDITGIEVLRRLRAAGNHVGVVMVTAAREADTVRAAAAGGAAHYLVKPFEFDDLRSRLEALRDAHEALTAGTPAQDEIDAVFAPVVAGPPKALPKGLSARPPTRCWGAAGRGGECPPRECADRVGISRVSARRYLEHFVSTGRATVRLQYGGRPARAALPRLLGAEACGQPLLVVGAVPAGAAVAGRRALRRTDRVVSAEAVVGEVLAEPLVRADPLPQVLGLGGPDQPVGVGCVLRERDGHELDAREPGVLELGDQVEQRTERVEVLVDRDRVGGGVEEGVDLVGPGQRAGRPSPC